MAPEADHAAWIRVAEDLAVGSSVSAAARAGGYERKHVYRLMKRPEFLQVLEAAKGRLATKAETGAAVGSEDVKASVGYLRKVVDGDVDGDAVRVAAAKILLVAGSGAASKRPAAPKPEEEKAKPSPKKPLDAKEAAARWRPRLA